jgi:ubiquinone/menaquinone biosynthesis methyltransferase
MLDRGVEKSRRSGLPVEWVEADAMGLPFPAAAFDVVTVAFGLRNIADTAQGLSEMARVCRPGGKLAILEFSLPRNAAIRNFYLWYFRNVLPRLGNAVARNSSDAYTYLNQSVEDFPSGERLAALVTTTAQGDLVRRELLARLDYLADVGLGYLTLDRQARSLSGGEGQRVALTAALGRYRQPRFDNPQLR